jgi:cellulose synthase/poly-beta-1,6-N-acetylglucosamine synthase-like glycosyltransferase
MVLIYFILLIYCFFIIWLLEGYKNVIKKNISDDGYNPFVSIVVAARDEATNLPILLDLLSNQNYPKDLYEIIIVNDRSIDSSASILKKKSEKLENLKIIEIDNCPSIWAGKKWALHNGIRNSGGEIIIQTDADCLMDKNWIINMVNPFKDRSIGFVSSLTPLLLNKNNIFKDLFLMDSIAQDIFSGYSIGKGLILSCNARSIAYRKSHFIDMKGYHKIKNIISGDDDLVLHKMVHNIGCRVRFIMHKDAAVYSKPPIGLLEFINQRMRYASKGLLYYKLDFISKEMKIILPFLYLVNVISTILIVQFCYTGSPVFLIALLFKIIPDYFIIHPIYDQFNFKWNWLSFIMLVVLHPFYLTIFSMIAPIYNFKWKE